MFTNYGTSEIWSFFLVVTVLYSVIQWYTVLYSSIFRPLKKCGKNLLDRILTTQLRVIFQVLMAANIKIPRFWNVTPCSLVGR
jgi:hypothetical protein